jgi:hypothetical protein
MRRRFRLTEEFERKEEGRMKNEETRIGPKLLLHSSFCLLHFL